MTYLTPAQQRNHIALGQLRTNYNIVNFWCNMQWPSWLEDITPLEKLKSMVMNSISKGMGKYLQHLDIIFVIETANLRDYSLKLREYAEGSAVGAYVEPREMIQGKNILYLNIIGLHSKSITGQRIGDRELQLLMDENIDHELTHVWHTRQSDMLQIYDKHEKMLNKVTTGFTDDVAAFDAQLQAIDDLQDPSKHIDMADLTAKAFAFLRKFVEDFKLVCLMEGVIRCMEAVIHEKDIPELVRQGYKDIEDVKKCFAEMSEAYEGLLLIASNIVKGRRVNWTVTPQLKERIQDNINKLHLKYAYTIGPAMIGLLWVNLENPLKRIVTLNMPQFYRLYEKVCAEKGVAPLIKVTSGKGGVLNLYEYCINLNKIRKKYKV